MEFRRGSWTPVASAAVFEVCGAWMGVQVPIVAWMRYVFVVDVFWKNVGAELMFWLLELLQQTRSSVLGK